MKRKPLLFVSVAVAYLATWVLIAWLSAPSLDPYGDMVENYAWSQTWALGSFKHPPLFAWMVRAWFDVFPTRVLPYFVLSYLNAGVGVLGIVCLARLWLPGDISSARRDLFVMTVLLFALLSAPYSNLAAKFNADTVLLSLWPWTAYAFFAALHAEATHRKWLFTLFLGLMAAAAMLGKYYSALLLASLFIISLSHPDYRRSYRSPYPYVAIAVSAALLLPHVKWEMREGFPFQQYLNTKIDAGISVPRIVLFWLSGIYYLPLSWLAWLVLRKRFAAPDIQPIAWAIPQRGLVLLCTLPALITGLFNLFARVHLTTHWAIPVWFALPVLLAVWLLPHLGEAFAWRRLSLGVGVVWTLVLLGGLIYSLVLSTTGNPKYSLAREEMVSTIEARFAARFPAHQLAWAGGTWPETGALAFFAPNHPRALPGFPDEIPALVNPYPGWQQRYGVIMCFASSTYAREGSHNTECERETRDWLHGHRVPVDEETLTYHAEGRRFIRVEPKNITVFWIPPAAAKPVTYTSPST
jgi:4-amino-4-deoxy-L-arabinose transferase-like glycosyltransferase